MIVLSGTVSTAHAGDAAMTQDKPLQLGDAAAPQPTLVLELGDAPEPDSALDHDKLDVRLADVTIEGEAVSGFRIFLNAPEAGAQTSIEDPAYVTSFSFFPEPAEGSSAGTFVVNLKPALTQLGEKPATLTLVPIGSEDAKIGISGSGIVE